MTWPTSIFTILLLLNFSSAKASVVCTHPDNPGLTYAFSGDEGLYTWSDHGIEHSWPLTCNPQHNGSTTCHRRERYGERGETVMIFHMLPDGTLIEASSLALLDVSTVRLTPGFTCTSNP